VIVALMACAAAPPPPVTNRGRTLPGPDVPHLFAQLFRTGASWTLPGVATVGGSGTKSSVNGTVVCRVDTVREIPKAWIAEIVCSGMPGTDQASGTYVATAAGLWRVYNFADKLEQLKPSSMSIAAEPKVESRTNDLSNGESEGYTVVRDHDNWCFAWSTNQADERGWMLCIHDNVGIVGGSTFFQAAHMQRSTFGTAPP